jgi:hypothetical protein
MFCVGPYWVDEYFYCSLLEAVCLVAVVLARGQLIDFECVRVYVCVCVCRMLVTSRLSLRYVLNGKEAVLANSSLLSLPSLIAASLLVLIG